jgi:hypothetical protein
MTREYYRVGYQNIDQEDSCILEKRTGRTCERMTREYYRVGYQNIDQEDT